MSKKKALFICLGNTCRSPIAEAVFTKLVTDRGISSEWDIDSAALAPWHIDEPPNDRSLEVIRTLNIPYEHVARQITVDDFRTADFIFGMDDYNMECLNQLATRDTKAQIVLLGSFDPQGERIIRDPYCDWGREGFWQCYEQCLRSCTAFLDTQISK